MQMDEINVRETLLKYEEAIEGPVGEEPSSIGKGQSGNWNMMFSKQKRTIAKS